MRLDRCSCSRQFCFVGSCSILETSRLPFVGSCGGHQEAMRECFKILPQHSNKHYVYLLYNYFSGHRMSWLLPYVGTRLWSTTRWMDCRISSWPRQLLNQNSQQGRLQAMILLTVLVSKTGWVKLRVIRNEYIHQKYCWHSFVKSRVFQNECILILKVWLKFFLFPVESMLQVNFNQVVLIGMAFGYFCLVLLVMDVYIKEKR